MLPPFYPLIDTGHLARVGSAPLDFAAMLARAGARIAQYRHKGEFTRSRFEEAEAIARLLHAAGALFIVNDRADIALAVGADGVHVGRDDLPVEDARRIIGPDMLLGCSTHDAAQLAAADAQPADYLAIGPMFATSTKANPDAVVGVAALPALRKLTDKPLTAIGGVTLENAAALLDAGADSLAAVSAVTADNAADWARLRPRRNRRGVLQ